MNKVKVKKFILIGKERFVNAEVPSTSVPIAYYLLFSLFPLIIIVGNFLPLLGIEPAIAIEYMEVLVPEPVQPVLEPIIESLLTSAGGGFLTFSSIALLWSASKGINYLQLGMNRVYGIKPNQGFLLRRILSLVTLLLIVILLLAFVLLFGFGEIVLSLLSPYFEWAQPLSDMLQDIRWPVTIIFMFCLMMVIYTITPDTKVTLKDALPGSIFTTVGLLLLVEAFSLYVRFATRTFSSYGTVSTFFVLMFWLNFSAMVLMVGGILNATIQEYHNGKAELEKNDLAHSIQLHLTEKLQKKWEQHKLDKEAAQKKPKNSDKNPDTGKPAKPAKEPKEPRKTKHP